MQTIEGWRGQPIRGVRSRRSGEFWALDWRDVVVDHAGAIEVKAHEPAERLSAWFTADELEQLQETCGHCSYVQSLRSEHTVTWSAFSPEVRDTILHAILERAFKRMIGARAAFDRQLWGLESPPRSSARRGLIADVVLRSTDASFAVETRWLADLDTRSVLGRISALADLAEQLGAGDRQRGVLVIAPSPTRYAWAHAGAFAQNFVAVGNRYRPVPSVSALGARAITWEEVAEVLDEKGEAERATYLRWRLSHLARRDV